MNANSKYEDEEILIRDLRHGDRDAYRYLVDKFHVRVIRTCMGYVHSTTDAEDIAQDVFIEVFRSVSSFRGESGLSTWIYRIAVNKSINFLRSASRRKFITFITGTIIKGEPQVPVANIEADTGSDDNLIRQEQARALDMALKSLPESQRTAFILNKYEELSYREISEVMGVSIGSVESLIFRARQGLQKKLYTFYKKNLH